jgi:FMN phosphatase YigB (HAD superfamily)
MKASEITPKKLVVFDIDDTLVHTQTKVHVVKDGEVVNSLNSHDFTHYKLQPGESFDFEDFRNAREFFEKSKPIIPMMNQLKRDIATGNKVVMVTARADFDDKELFLDTFRKYGVDIDKVHVYRAGNIKSGTTEERKKAIIKNLLDKDDYTKAIMYDDAKPNLHTFIELKKDHPRTRFYAWHVSLDGEASEYMREHIEEKWSEKYKRSINCNNPKGFSQRAHCQGRKKKESIEETIRKQGSKYVIYSKDGSKKLGTYDSRKAAEKRLGQIEYFKHKG